MSCSLLFVAALPHAVQFAICCCTATCRTVCYLLPHTVQIFFVSAHCTAWYLLSHAVQLAICCLVLYSFLFVFIYRAVCFHCHMPYSLLVLPHAVQFTIYRRMLYNLLFVAACRTARYLLQHAPQLDIPCSKPYGFLFVAACLTVRYSLPHAIQFAVCCSMPGSLPYV